MCGEIMIVEFKIRNFLSIKEEQILSFEADKTKKYNDYLIIKAGKYNLLKLIAICGPNASGKTNIINAFEALRTLIVGSGDIRIFQYPPYFAADPIYNSGNTEFKLDFLIDDNESYVRYRYEISFNYLKNIINYEKLEYFPSQKPALIYERKVNTSNGRGFELKIPGTMRLKKAEMDAIKANTFEYTTILSVFQIINPLFPQAKNAFTWFKNSTLPKITPQTPIMQGALQYFEESTKRKKFLIEFLKNADINITDLSISKIEEDAPEEMANILKNIKNTLPRKTRPEFSNTKITRYDTHFIHKSNNNGVETSYSLPLSSESLGTYRIFELAYPMWLAVTGSKILMIDEIESSLHLEMVKYILLVYLMNSEKSQMLFTTHNLMLMDWDVMINDFIWFTEKDESGETILYPLSSFNGLNRQKILKQYMAGNFGAFPDIYQYKFDLNRL